MQWILFDLWGVIGRESFDDSGKPSIAFVEGMKSLIQKFGVKHKLCLVTSAHPEDLAFAVEILKLDSLFDEIIASHEIGISKASSVFYERVLEEIGALASDCIFIDDSAANCEAARKIGIDAIQFVDADRLQLELLKRKIT